MRTWWIIFKISRLVWPPKIYGTEEIINNCESCVSYCVSEPSNIFLHVRSKVQGRLKQCVVWRPDVVLVRVFSTRLFQGSMNAAHHRSSAASNASDSLCQHRCTTEIPFWARFTNAIHNDFGLVLTNFSLRIAKNRFTLHLLLIEIHLYFKTV